MMGGDEKEKNSSMDLEKFAEIILKRDETRDDLIISEMVNLTKEVSRLASICAVSAEQHLQHRKERDKTDGTLKNHGKRIYTMEKQILGFEIIDKIEQKKSDNLDKIKVGVVIIVLAAMILAYFEMNKKPDTVKHPTPITQPIN